MTINVKILNTKAESVSRDELASFFVSDMNFVPYRRRAELSRDGEITITFPQGPVILQAKLIVPGYGHVWITADKCGKGYDDGECVEFVREAAESRIAETDTLLAGGGFAPSVKCLSMLSDAKTLLKTAGASDALRAAEYRTAALAAAMWAGDLAVVERARARIAERKMRNNFLFGCAGFEYPFEHEPGLKEIFDSVFNYATLPFYLARVEPERGRIDYSTLDRLQDAFERQGIETKGHPLWWAHTAGMPSWTKDLKWNNGSASPGSIRHEIDRVITDRVRHFRGRIHYYDVINEAHDWCNAWMMNQQELCDMTKACADALHNADPSCTAVVNTCFMFGENAADGRVQWGLINERNMVPWSYLRKLEETGAQYEAIGMQLYCPGRDMLAIDKLYDRFKVFGKPYHITELGVPSCERDVPPSTTEGDIYCLRYMYKGLWHEMGWNERLQADWIEDFYTLSYAHSEVEALTWWSIHDGSSYVPAAGIVREDGVPKEGVARLRELEKHWGFH
ncbi:MAG: endo-1,4-beta-xylanase [Treponema sp.]|jgi:GH35 family endo-1,4-beta-xylanase|nr:endo-1,4-beta-xylanase [Treponema sp.]